MIITSNFVSMEFPKELQFLIFDFCHLSESFVLIKMF